MSEFHKFAALMRERFEKLSKHELFVVDVEKDTVWDAYLAAFPEGSNPIYRERTSHDCSCCKQFVRNIGNVVAIVDGKIESVWAVEGAEEPYKTVAEELTVLVEELPIKGVFRSRELAYGAAHTIELLEGNQTQKWHHFVAKVERKHQTQDVEAEVGKLNSVAQVFRRGLEELSVSALNEVVDLINENALYRGAEHKQVVNDFYVLKTAYDDPATDKGLFIWANIHNRAARFRNTVIGTLVQDLSEGMDLERAVKAFETKVAPTNYKRPTALITPRMVDDAMKTITELGLEPALERRFARIEDVSVGDVLFVDNSVQEAMKGGVKGLLMEEAVLAIPDTSKAEKIGIDEFLERVVPKARSIDLLVKNSMGNNFMSLTAPVNEGVKPIFKWGNNFAWSYDGGVADSIKEKVKRAGGNVENATMRVSLAWFNYDDLDIHVIEPDGNEIYFRNRSNKLDVDMNAGGGQSREQVENVSWVGHVPDGVYRVFVSQYQKRETKDVGFTLEVESGGIVQTFTYDGVVKWKIACLRMTVKDGVVDDILAFEPLSRGSTSVEKWGINTETLVPVDTLLASPNHWSGESTGNKHWFFILKGCKNPMPVRGIYNEFLKPELEKHRKVFEVLGNKTLCPTAESQLSGLGFSSTRKEAVTVFVKGEKLQKAYEINF